jgi:hypothetical protein
MGNSFVSAYRYYAHLLDILGSEIFDVTESESYAAVRRCLCYQKNNTNLLQWFEDESVTHEEIETYIKNQMFWGFIPGIASSSGGIGLGETLNRYFSHPELYERDRDLFRKYIPIIRELSDAGWEPITYSKSDSENICIERFGNVNEGIVLLTMKSANGLPVTSTVTFDFGTDPYQVISVEEIISGIPVELNWNSGIASMEISIPKDEIFVFKFCTQSSSIEKFELY